MQDNWKDHPHMEVNTTKSIEHRPVGKTTKDANPLTCKRVNIVDEYFSDEENQQPKVNIMRFAKDGTWYSSGLVRERIS